VIGSTVSTALAGIPWEVTRGKASSTAVPPRPRRGPGRPPHRLPVPAVAAPDQAPFRGDPPPLSICTRKKWVPCGSSAAGRGFGGSPA